MQKVHKEGPDLGPPRGRELLQLFDSLKNITSMAELRSLVRTTDIKQWPRTWQVSRKG